MARQFENNTFAHADYINQVGTNGDVQTFTPQVKHDMLTLTIKVARRSTPGTVTLTTHTTDGEGHPTGSALSTDIFDGDALTTDLNNPDLKTITISTPPTLTNSIKYAIKLVPTNYTVNTVYLAWYHDGDNSYANGDGLYFSGGEWIKLASDADFYFDEYGGVGGERAGLYAVVEERFHYVDAYGVERYVLGEIV